MKTTDLIKLIKLVQEFRTETMNEWSMWEFKNTSIEKIELKQIALEEIISISQLVVYSYLYNSKTIKELKNIEKPK